MGQSELKLQYIRGPLTLHVTSFFSPIRLRETFQIVCMLSFPGHWQVQERNSKITSWERWQSARRPTAVEKWLWVHYYSTPNCYVMGFPSYFCNSISLGTKSILCQVEWKCPPIPYSKRPWEPAARPSPIHKTLFTSIPRSMCVFSDWTT